MIILLVLPSVFGEITNYHNYSSLKLRFSENAALKLTKEGGAKLENLEVDLALVPRSNEMQSILSLDVISNPSASVTQNGNVLYEWNNIYDKYEYGLNSDVEVRSFQHKVPFVSFPVFGLSEDLEKYTRAGEKIDINTEITDLANDLAKGENDLFSATFNIAEWINENIEYNLNTLTADAVQQSTWVLTNREGVCDEITNLFISMLRSVGVPARFVSGMVYSNIDNGFGNHGWAEVYFPGYGWVPYDVTFGQYGYLDPTHLKLDDAFDSDEPSVSYTWKSSGIEVKADPLVTETEIIELGGAVESPYFVDVDALKNKVGPGSYVPMEISLMNPYDYYTSNMLVITKAPKLLEDNSKQVLLKPQQEKKVYWIIEIPKNLDPNYIYTTIVEVKDFYGKTSSVEVEYSSHYETYTLKEAQSLVERKSEKEEKSYSTELKLDCNLSKEYYYVYETGKINCDVINIGNSALNDLNVCFRDDCRSLSLGISQNEKLNFEFSLGESSEIFVNAQNKDVDVSSFLNLDVYSEPDLRITNLVNELEKRYSESFDLEFILVSSVLVKDLEISVNGKKYSEIEEVKGSRRIMLPLKAKDFVDDEIELSINYMDENNKDYNLNKKVEINVINVPWYAKFLLFFKNLF